jgi:hypothetical protein
VSRSRRRSSLPSRVQVVLTLTETALQCLDAVSEATGVTSESYAADMVSRCFRNSDEFLGLEQRLACHDRDAATSQLSITLSPEGRQCLQEVAAALGLSQSQAFEVAVRMVRASDELRGFETKQQLMGAARQVCLERFGPSSDPSETTSLLASMTMGK